MSCTLKVENKHFKIIRRIFGRLDCHLFEEGSLKCYPKYKLDGKR